ncbi:MAG: hypothetical protein LBI42_15005 [Chitinispirillales bacterium]|nr:hypothetical protein [Chitinispirillales bacterium]
MSRINAGLWLIIMLLSVINYVNASDISRKIKIDTLCAYGIINDFNGNYLLKDKTELTSFLKSTMYDENGPMIIRKKTHRPDFKKWTYFAFAGADWPRNTDISYKKDTIVITFTKFLPPDIPGGPQYAPPAPVAVIYFIPFTENSIFFEDIVKRR